MENFSQHFTRDGIEITDAHEIYKIITEGKASRKLDPTSPDLSEIYFNHKFGKQFRANTKKCGAIGTDIIKRFSIRLIERFLEHGKLIEKISLPEALTILKEIEDDYSETSKSNVTRAFSYLRRDPDHDVTDILMKTIDLGIDVTLVELISTYIDIEGTDQEIYPGKFKINAKSLKWHMAFGRVIDVPAEFIEYSLNVLVARDLLRNPAAPVLIPRVYKGSEWYCSGTVISRKFTEKFGRSFHDEKKARLQNA